MSTWIALTAAALLLKAFATSCFQLQRSDVHQHRTFSMDVFRTKSKWPSQRQQQQQAVAAAAREGAAQSHSTAPDVTKPLAFAQQVLPPSTCSSMRLSSQRQFQGKQQGLTPSLNFPNHLTPRNCLFSCCLLSCQVETNADMTQLLSARVQQAFLPKFENEGLDTSIADAIVAQADDRCGALKNATHLALSGCCKQRLTVKQGAPPTAILRTELHAGLVTGCLTACSASCKLAAQVTLQSPPGPGL